MITAQKETIPCVLLAEAHIISVAVVVFLSS